MWLTLPLLLRHRTKTTLTRKAVKIFLRLRAVAPNLKAIKIRKSNVLE
jgi:hypothetical protein